MAVPIFESFSTFTGRNVGPHILAAPDGIEEGDLLIAFCQVRDNFDFRDWVPPNDWINLDPRIYTQLIASRRFYKIAGSNEPTSYFFEIRGAGSGTAWCSAVIARISGANASAPFNVFSYAINNSQTCPSVTTTVDECLLLSWFGHNGGGWSRSFDEPAGYTRHWVIASEDSGAEGQGGASKPLGPAGSTGTASWVRTAGSAITTVNYHIAIAPGEAGGISPAFLRRTRIIGTGIL